MKLENAAAATLLENPQNRDVTSSSSSSSGGPLLPTSAGGEEEAHVPGTCAICLDAKATWIYEACGHRCVCKPCARKQKEKALGGAGGARRKKGGKKRASALMPCPLCRTETRVVPGSRYEGEVFVS